jgi:hypothetical protein
VLTITGQMYDMYWDIVSKVGKAANCIVLNQRVPFNINHTAKLIILVFIDIPDREDQVAEEFFDMSGATYYLKEIAKDHGGKWDGAKRAWEGIAMGAIPPLLQKCKNIGILVEGNHVTG